MKKIVDRYTNNIFENIKHMDEYGNEYWYARELSKVLEYKDWRNFLKVLNKAKDACKNSGFNIDEQLVAGGQCAAWRSSPWQSQAFPTMKLPRN